MNNVDLKSVFKKFNAAVHRALETAMANCVTRTNYDIEIEHIFLALLADANNDFSLICKHFGIETAKAEAELNRVIDDFKTGSARRPGLSPTAIELIRDSWFMSSLEFGGTEIRSGYFLFALCQDRRQYGLGTDLFERIAADKLKSDFATIVVRSVESAEAATDDEPKDKREATPTGTKALDKFTIDLTAQARSGKLDPIIGRDAEIRQMIDILCRRRQNNPIITGDAGVGKTAVVEGLAQYIADGKVPPQMKNVTLRTLDLALLQAGAGVRGEFENRLKGVIEEVKGSPTPIVLFIDEAHNLIGAGGQSGQGDAANLIKPALARGELRTIAATTWAEYKKYFEEDAALARRFQVVKVEEPEPEVCVMMMQGLLDTLEKHHKVRITSQAVEDAVNLSKRYIAGRQLPDKAVSLLDTTCARIHLSQTATPPPIDNIHRNMEQLQTKVRILKRQVVTTESTRQELEQLEQEIKQQQQELEKLERRWQEELRVVGELNQCYAQVAQSPPAAGATQPAVDPKLIERIMSLEAELKSLQGDEPLVHAACDSPGIAETISSWTGIPVGKMMADEIRTVLNLEQQLEQNVVGQSHALMQIAETIKTARAKLTDPGRPIGVFLLAGTSGTGKTETALTLANLLYGGEQNMTTINMSEFKEEHKVSLLMGSPPGYVGSEKGGVLTEAVRRKPYSVVLLDELEKAHPGVQEIFYQVFDKGHMMDGTGRVIDFKNTLIIMTSNAGSDLVKSLCSDPETRPTPEALAEALHAELLNHFKPAFLGRLTVIPYYPLTDDVLRNITRLKLNKIRKRILENYNARLELSDEVIEAIVKRCTEVDTGARNIDKIVNKTLLPELSISILQKMAAEESFHTVHVNVGSDGRFIYELK